MSISNVLKKAVFVLAASFFYAFSLSAQINVAGYVTDGAGEPMPGVNVLVKGTTVGVTTDTDGRYTIRVPDRDAVLSFSFMGYTTVELRVGNSTQLNAVLNEDAQQIEEVVVVGYGTQKKANLTGSVGTADSDVLEDRPVANLGQALQGTVAGLNITSADGTPGGGVSFNIRGTTNLSGSGAPLVLVDGIMMDPNILNPADIKSVTVLKDAASAAIYGARAAFGVVLITTKTGYVTRKPVVSVSANYSINKPTVRPKSMNSLEYANWMNAANLTTAGGTFFPELEYNAIEAHFKDPSAPTVIYNPGTGLYQYAANTDWYEIINKRTFPMQNYNVTVSGGSRDVRYYASAGYFNQKGQSKWMVENYDRFNLMQNLMYRVNDWLETGLRTSLNVSDNQTGNGNKMGWNSVTNMWLSDASPIMPLYHPDGHFSGNTGGDNGNFTNLAALQSLGGTARNRANEAVATALIVLKPFAGMKINADYTYDFYTSRNKSHRRQYLDYTPSGTSMWYTHTSPNLVNYREYNNRYQAINVYAEYEKKLGSNHELKAMVGFNQEWQTASYVDTERASLISNDVGYISTAYGDRVTNDSEQEWAVRGAFYRLNYAYAEKYLLELTGRYDGSSRFPSADRFAFFPSFSGGWRISKENFWQGISHIANEFKIRAGYGTLGNQMVSGYYPYILSYGTAEANYMFDGRKEMNVTAPGLVSPNLTWETVGQLNLGVEAGFMNDKLTATFDYYRRTTKDMLMPGKRLPSILAVSEPEENAADLRTTGWDMTLNWKDQLDNGLKYGINLSIWDYTSEVIKYDNPTKMLSSYYEGQQLGEIWGLVTEGLFASDAEAAATDQSAFSGITLLEGDIKFADLDGKPGITRGANTADDPGDRKIIGNSTPRYQYGLRLSAEWKGFDVAVFFQGTMKRQVRPDGQLFYNHYTSRWNTPQKINTDYWSEANPDAFFPRPRFNAGGLVTEAQTRFLQNAAYIRLKQLTVGYTVPFKYTEKLGISQCRVYFSSNNLWEAHKMMKTFDPELPRVNAYPFFRSFSFGANLTF